MLEYLFELRLSAFASHQILIVDFQLMEFFFPILQKVCIHYWYLHKKRQAISKAVKSTKEGLDARPTKRLSDINSVSGIPSLGDMIRKK